MSRGILAVVSAPIGDNHSMRDVRDVYEQAYASEQFVKVLDEGVFPSTSSTLGSNMALIGLAIDRSAHRLITIAAIDNLVKGTAGGAIQSMNIALSFPEHLGLTTTGVAP
jgi:N-acetyl-gamma-glutamyl-phosphate reductase